MFLPDTVTSMAVCKPATGLCLLEYGITQRLSGGVNPTIVQ